MSNLSLFGAALLLYSLSKTLEAASMSHFRCSNATPVDKLTSRSLQHAPDAYTFRNMERQKDSKLTFSARQRESNARDPEKEVATQAK